MRTLLATALLVTFLVPLANAHVVLCAPDEDGICRVTTIAGRPESPPHASVFVAPCFCAHAEANLALDRVLP